MRDGHLRVVGIGGTLREGSSSLGALRRALDRAEDSGAETELLDLRELALPMYEPGRSLDDYGPEVRDFVEAVREADALILSTAAYHGTLAGVTKNALDFTQFLTRDERPYLEGRIVGLICTAGGDQGATNANHAMVDTVHTLRGIVAPLMVAIPGTWRITDDAGNITDDKHGGRLDQLGALVVELAERLSVPVESCGLTLGKGVSTRLLLAVVVSAILVSVLNQTFTNVVVPDIQQDFGTSQGQTGWVITGYMLIFAVGIPLYGRIADLYSLRFVFSTGLVVLAAGSLVCALAPTLPVLVAGRIVQAAGASAIPALGFASVAKAMPPGERGAALGLLSSSVGAGAAVGPVVGGAIAGLTGWQALFYLTLVMSLALAPAALRSLPGAPETDGAPSGLWNAIHHFDVPGGLALALAAGLALFGVTEGQAEGFGSPVAWGSFVLSLVAVVFFVGRIRGVAEPFVSPRLFRNRAFLAASGVGFFFMFTNLGSLILAPLMLSEINGLSAAGIGLVLAPGAVVVAVLSPVAGRLSDRFGPRLLVRAGLVTILLSTLFISTVAAGASPVLVAAGLLGQGLGFAAVNSPNANAASGALPREESGVGLGIYQMLFFLGGGFGPAIGATFLALREQTGSGALNPLYALDAAAFSDAFLLLAFAVVIAFAASFGYKSKVESAEDLPERPSEPQPAEE